MVFKIITFDLIKHQVQGSGLSSWPYFVVVDPTYVSVSVAPTVQGQAAMYQLSRECVSKRDGVSNKV